MRLGNGLWETSLYNSRLQATQVGLGTAVTDASVWKLTNDYGTSSNNGNVRSQVISAPNFNVTQSYAYDALHRLQSARETSGGAEQWKQTFLYDQYGNRTIDAAQTTFGLVGANPAVSTATNRISAAGYVYDAAGNLTRNGDATPIVYDGENRQVGYGEAGYSYDADGRRVKKTWAGVTTVFVYDAAGQLVAEYASEAQVAQGGGGTSYVTQDQLGATRVVTGSTGQVKTRIDMLPFGEEIAKINATLGGRNNVAGYGVDVIRQKYAGGYERDEETGLDFAQARYYSSTQGRFTSPDEFKGGAKELFILGSGDGEKQALPYADITDPQTLNKYQYCLNNPLRYIDPSGHQQQDSWWESLKNYIFNLGQQLDRQARPQELPERQGGHSAAPLSQGTDALIREHSQELARRTEIANDVVMLADVTGAGSAVQSYLKAEATGYRNTSGGQVAAETAVGAAGMVFNKFGGGIARQEFRALYNSFGRGTYQTIGNQIRDHFGRHGAEVGAKNVIQYMRQATAFARNLRGARTSQLENGATRYTKNGRYVIKDSDGKIVSYGAAR